MRRTALLVVLVAGLVVVAVGIWKRGPIERRVDAFLHPDERATAAPSAGGAAPVPETKGTTRGDTVGIDVRVLRSGRDFEASSLASPDGPETQFGYSVSCPPAPVGRDEPALAISSYLADDERGRVHVAPQRALEGRLSGDAVRRQMVSIGVDSDPPAWFGHEVALADVSGDGAPDLLSGARYAYGQLGSSWYVDGAQIRGRFGRGGKWTLSHDDASEYRSEGLPGAKEMGFSVALVPGADGARGKLAMRAANARGGQLEGGAIALVDPPGRPGRRALRPGDFSQLDPQPGQDYGGVLDVVTDRGRSRLLTGGWSNPQFFKLPYVDGKAWEVPLDRSPPKAIFSLASAVSDPVSRQLSPDVFRTPQGARLVVGSMKPWSGPLDPAGVFVMRDGAPVFLTAPELQGVSFPFSIDAHHDLDGDGVPEIVGSAASWARDARGSAEGAVVVLHGGDVARAVERPGSRRVRAAVLEWDAPGDNTGSKRRLCLQDQPRQKRTLLVAGAPYGEGGLVMAAIKRDTLWGAR